MTGYRHQAIIDIQSQVAFEQEALRQFEHQYAHNKVYRQFCDHLRKSPKGCVSLTEIPFLPIEFFKRKKILAANTFSKIFTSSGTTGSQTSKHYVSDLSLYEASFIKAFENFYGPIKDYCVLALLPSYLEREGSSLVYMAERMIQLSTHTASGFFLNNFESLKKTIDSLEKNRQKTLLLGVSFALLDFAEQYPTKLNHTIVMETGGMKGRKKEMTRHELHAKLKEGFGVDTIHSEYGMTELLSQAYSKGEGKFMAPPWMRVIIRNTEDPLSFEATGKTGGINVIDLANIHSCSFIATQDLGRTITETTFEVLGRFDNSDVRGCNLMAI